jgi:hypothetical protein
MLITYPDFFPYWIQDPTKTEQGKNKLVVLSFLVENFESTDKKLLLSSQKIWVGSGIWKKLIPDPGVKKAPDPGSGSATLADTRAKRKTYKTIFSCEFRVIHIGSKPYFISSPHSQIIFSPDHETPIFTTDAPCLP